MPCPEQHRLDPGDQRVGRTSVTAVLHAGLERPGLRRVRPIRQPAGSAVLGRNARRAPGRSHRRRRARGATDRRAALHLEDRGMLLCLGRLASTGICARQPSCVRVGSIRSG